jgi:hypothetical protein
MKETTMPTKPKKKKSTKRPTKRKSNNSTIDRVIQVMSSPVVATALELVFKEVSRAGKRR